MAQHEIKSLSVRNFKGVNHIDLKPTGSLVVLAGGNGEGKSSFIDAIAEMFDPKGVRLTPKPIREGAEEAVAELTTSQARIVRTWKKNDAGKLEAYALDGAKYQSGKDFVLGATGGALFDPYEFVKLDEKAQRAQLLERISLPFDLGELDRQRAGVYELRADVNRVVTQLTGQLAGMPEPVEDLPAEEVSAADILAEHAAAREHNEKLDAAVRQLEQLDSQKEHAAANVERLTAELAEAQSYLEGIIIRRDDAYDAFKTGPERLDLSVITEKLTNVEQTNARVRAAQERAKVAADLASKRERSTILTLDLEAIDKKKADALAAAQFPVDGLNVDDDGITFNGIPFKQVNTAQKTAIAFDLATLAQPDLRLVIIKDGDSLDADSLASIEQIATERGYIVLVERDRDESREIGFVIEHGSLVQS